ncbi:DoxX family protein [Aestuariimicrobium soli]|uniref:DoxX family protein n=1 Tax=Aestuariimicrobium soli TaxID=2035834 RepID=UPI003EB6FD6D
MRGFIRVCQDLALMLARIATGAILMVHGWTRWSDGQPKQVQILTDLKVPYPEVFAWGTIAFEVIGGALLVFGLVTPLLGLVLLVEQAMIIGFAKWGHGPHLAQDGYEYNLALASLGLIFLTFGSGRAGVDALFRRSPDDRQAHYIDDADPA